MGNQAEMKMNKYKQQCGAKENIYRMIQHL